MVQDAATVVIVSHNLNYLKQVCDRMVFMKNGKVEFSGPVDECVQEYRSSISQGGK